MHSFLFSLSVWVQINGPKIYSITSMLRNANPVALHVAVPSELEPATGTQFSAVVKLNTGSEVSPASPQPVIL
jgi:hypothetical protein